MDAEMINRKLQELPTDHERNQYLRDLLSKHDCEITFTKLDGATRIMPCTLRTEIMPQRELSEAHSSRTRKPETLSVWCLDQSQWRSFRVDRVQHVKILDIQ